LNFLKFVFYYNFSQNSSDPNSYAFNFEYFERNNQKIDKIKLEGNKKLLVMVDKKKIHIKN